MFLIVSKVARELLNDFELTSLHIEKFSFCEVYILRDLLDRSLIRTWYSTNINRDICIQTRFILILI